MDRVRRLTVFGREVFCQRTTDNPRMLLACGAIVEQGRKLWQAYSEHRDEKLFEQNMVSFLSTLQALDDAIQREIGGKP